MSKKRATDLIQMITDTALVKFVLDWTKTHSLPGFGGVPIFDVFSFIYQEAQKDDITTRANSMAFSFFIALFPAVIFLFTLIAYFPIADNFMPALKDYLERIMPTRAGDYLFNMIIDVVAIQRGGLLSAGFFLAIYFASNGMLAMLRGFEKSYPQSFRQRNIFEKRWVAIRMTFLSIILLVVSVSLVVLWSFVMKWLTNALGFDFIHSMVFSVIQFVIVGITLYAIISIIYRQGPAFYEKLSWFSPGTSLATSLSLLTSLGFSYFVNNYGTYNQVYGAIGALIVILLWVQINCFIILIGFELNASIRVNRDLRRHALTEG